MKNTLNLLTLLCVSLTAFAQRPVTTYYDWNKIHPHEQYTINSYGQKSGPFKEYNEQGVVITECYYVNGLASGECSTYWADDKNKRVLAGKATYKQGELNGPFIAYDQAGVLKEKGIYVNGKKQGAWTAISTLPDGIIENPPADCKYISTVVTVKDGEIINNGMLKVNYYPSGKLFKECRMKNGQPTENSTIYYPDGKIRSRNITNEDGDLFISKTSYSHSGKLVYYQTFHNGRSNNWFTEDTLWDYNEDGTPTANMKQQTDNYANWKRTGLCNAGRTAHYQAIPLIRQGDTIRSKALLDEAIGYYETALSVKVIDGNAPADGNVYYNLACSYAMRGNASKGIDMLKLALENGYKDFRNLKSDSDLNALRSMSEYNSLLEKYQADTSH